jgi:multidrug efflux pump subunit AcrB
MPSGSLPPFVMNYNASTVPILQLGVSSEKMDESQLYDLASNFIRPQLSTIPGASVLWAYGGKQRQVMINLNPQQPAARQFRGRAWPVFHHARVLS